MNPQIILIFILSFLIIEYLLTTLLSIMNLNESLKNKSDIPAFFQNHITQDDYVRSIQYNQSKGRFGLLSNGWSFLVMMAVLMSGFPGVLEYFLLRYIPAGNLFSIAYLLLLSFLSSIMSIPFSLYSQFVIEEEYGFNKSSFSLYFSDTVKQLLISLILFPILLWGLFFFMDKSGDYWWIYASSFIVAFQLIMFLLYPVLIAPLFNKFTPLEDGSLKDRLMSLAERCDFSANGIYLMDGSKRSGHSNAYFTGFGKLKRIVLFDTLIESMSEEELEAVLAHEIGHNKLKHIQKRLISVIFTIFALFFIISLTMKWTSLYHAFGFSNAAYHSILFIIMICASPISFLFSPVSNYFSRKHEYEADAYACSVVEKKSALSDALLSLGRENLSNLTPHPLFSTFYYSHPALSERLEAMKPINEDTKE